MPRTTSPAPAPEAAASTEPIQPPRRYGTTLNQVNLAARLAAAPVLRYTASGTAVCSLRVAVNDRDGVVSYFDVVAWNRDAEFAAKYLTKGRLVFISGRLHSRKWVGEDGVTRYGVEVVADQLQALTPPPPAVATGEEPVTEDA
ncbi:MAG: single-stranded DNA-binding protein [Candidatus Dormibacteria bacterium]